MKVMILAMRQRQGVSVNRQQRKMAIESLAPKQKLSPKQKSAPEPTFGVREDNLRTELEDEAIRYAEQRQREWTAGETSKGVTYVNMMEG
jgi:hypothetical protein